MVWVRVGLGLGIGIGEGEGRGEGGVTTVPWICGTMMTGLCVLSETSVFRQVHYRRLGSGGCGGGGGCGGCDGGWWVVVVV